MMRLLLILPMLTGCTTLQEGGHVVFSTSSNIKGLHYQSPAGTVLYAESIDNAAIHRAAWNGATKGILGIGTAAATSGVTQYWR